MKDLEIELAQLRAENEALRKHGPVTNRLGQPISVPQLPNKPGIIRADGIDDGNNSTSPMISSVAKVVQPTATVTSVPVSGPSTLLLFLYIIFFLFKHLILFFSNWNRSMYIPRTKS